MGLLDDAIREHLELKRRRGANPGEVEREEVEALGPVRRGEIEVSEPGAAAPAVTAEPRDDPLTAEHDAGAAGYDDDPAPAPEPAAPEPAPRAPAAHEAPAPEVDRGDDLDPDEHDHTPPHGDAFAQPTREFSTGELEEALGERQRHEPEDAAPKADEDVLEETPDFLQETPEHDRLWFEQKPPKDFDF